LTHAGCTQLTKVFTVLCKENCLNLSQVAHDFFLAAVEYLLCVSVDSIRQSHQVTHAYLIENAFLRRLLIRLKEFLESFCQVWRHCSSALLDVDCVDYSLKSLDKVTIDEQVVHSNFIFVFHVGSSHKCVVVQETLLHLSGHAILTFWLLYSSITLDCQVALPVFSKTDLIKFDEECFVEVRDAFSLILVFAWVLEDVSVLLVEVQKLGQSPTSHVKFVANIIRSILCSDALLLC
jgi:hypothetical protein